MKKRIYTYRINNSIQIVLFVLFFGILITNVSAQEGSFVYMKNGEFYRGCEAYNMIGVNYFIDRIETPDGNTYISPSVDQCGTSGCGPIWYSCGSDSAAWQNELIDHLNKIKSLKFNTT